jgi:hypothetical protein
MIYKYCFGKDMEGSNIPEFSGGTEESHENLSQDAGLWANI